MKSKPLKVLFALLFLAFVGAVILNPKATSKHYYQDVSGPLVIAHQGVDGIITDRPDLLLEVLGR